AVERVRGHDTVLYPRIRGSERTIGRAGAGGSRAPDGECVHPKCSRCVVNVGSLAIEPGEDRLRGAYRCEADGHASPGVVNRRNAVVIVSTGVVAEEQLPHGL